LNEDDFVVKAHTIKSAETNYSNPFLQPKK